ncbi:hypothetical protein Sa4125_29800 [Aureimonas sp. SA4125]|uniref:hypothetical protein n=1 Tax=Aureimonas sp. SA4125 TaxID=2826993 RepID=UPI001CC3E4D5|nr:hypothetical protein [Aureimonas sp. SA4125]BDA85438.1 hypothetical protein Sa4125_29800 [Aureimonas sp. SA4125]
MTIVVIEPGEWIGLADDPVRGTFGDGRGGKWDPDMWDHVVTAADPVLPDVGTIANAIWLATRDREDRSDMALKDMPRDCTAWVAARAVLKLLTKERS